MTASLRSELSLLSELSCLQQQGAVCDTRLVTDTGHSAAVHWPLLAKRGVWWAELARHASCPGHAPDTVVLVQGVTQLQLQQFVEELYAGTPQAQATIIPIISNRQIYVKDDIKNDVDDDTYRCEVKIEHAFYEDENTNDGDDGDDDDYVDEEDENQDQDLAAVSTWKDKIMDLIIEGKYETVYRMAYDQMKQKFPSCVKIEQEEFKKLIYCIEINQLDEEYQSGSASKREQKKRFFHCSQCGTDIPYFDKILKHVTKHFKKVYYCEECNKFAKNMDSHLYMLHNDAKRESRTNKCEICSKNFISKQNLEIHVATSHQTVYCDQCDFQCVGNEKLSRHKFKKHKEHPVQIFSCELCGKQLKCKQALEEHIKHKHTEAAFRCEHCDKMFKSEKHLRAHIRDQHDEKKIVCDLCGQRFSLKHKHDEHFRIHHSEERSFNCEYCDYKGKTKKFLDSHMLCHKEPKHECPHCGKMFRQISSFKHHIMTHTGEKPYHCRECSFKCIQPYDLTKHYSKTHGMIIKNPGSFRQNYSDHT